MRMNFEAELQANMYEKPPMRSEKRETSKDLEVKLKKFEVFFPNNSSAVHKTYLLL